MTPDMKRLCEALHQYHTAWGEIGCMPEDAVCAILTAIREPSRAMKDAASLVEVDGNYPESFTIGPDKAAEVFTAMIDHILDTNAAVPKPYKI